MIWWARKTAGLTLQSITGMVRKLHMTLHIADTAVMPFSNTTAEAVSMKPCSETGM